MRCSVKLEFDEVLLEAKPMPEAIFCTKSEKESESGCWTAPTRQTRGGVDTDGFSKMVIH